MNLIDLTDQEAEKKLLGSLILDEEVRIELATEISADDFYKNKHKRIFSTIYALENDPNLEVDLVTLSSKLRDDIQGVTSYITSELTEPISTTVNADSLANIVREQADRRRMVRSAAKIEELAQNKDENVEKLLAEAEQSIFELSSEAKKDRSYQKISDMMLDVLNNIQAREVTEDGVVGTGTPFKKLNELTGGLQESKMSIVAARPGFGKSTLASNIAQHAAIEEDASVGFFSLEMNKDEVISRTIANECMIEYQKIERNTASNKEWENIMLQSSKISDSDIYINDTPGLTINEIRSDIRKMKLRDDVDVVLVDYAELVKTSRHMEKNERLQEVAQGLADTAKKLDIHVILISQLNRNCEKRNNKRPILSDLKGSSGLEQAADVIMFLYRESEYNKDIDDKFKGLTELIVRKNRQGETGFILLDFRGQYYQFLDVPQRLKKGYENWLKN